MCHPTQYILSIILEKLPELSRHQKSITLHVRVRPNATRSACRGKMEDGSWKIDVKAPPEDGKANAELIRFLAKQYGIPRDTIRILRGISSRKKQIQILRKEV